ncbi:hypothetical protein DUI87_14916 [Hirundo rustica rustica]|uniref:Cytosolic carboxypeptidase N-terminal domain-containing protein n=1 Tax=Hirundo rustica rustica TaxID=333673 RepID=A0A3M0K6A7_HIRRU|nr:hypothetical protein DUI87_14916 [Hirundo rustica rustica]
MIPLTSVQFSSASLGILRILGGSSVRHPVQPRAADQLKFAAHAGNLGRVDHVTEFEYDLFIRPDTCNPRFRVWFNFTVENVKESQLLNSWPVSAPLDRNSYYSRNLRMIECNVYLERQYAWTITFTDAEDLLVYILSTLYEYLVLIKGIMDAR